MKKQAKSKSEQRRGHKNPGRQYRLLCELMDNIPDVIYFKDLKGRLLLVNQAHARGLGLKPEQVAGKTDFDFFPKERAAMMRKDDELVMHSAKPIIDKVERSTRADGIDNYVSTTKIPRFGAKGKVIGLIGITRDITRRMHFEGARKEKLALEKKLEALEELSKLKSEFISVVSHELRTPLAIVKEAAALVFDGIAGPVNEKQKGFLKKAQDNITRLGRIIEELLEISRIEAKRIKLHYALVDLSALLKDSEGFFRRQAAEKGIKLEYRLPRKEVNIFVDAERVNQVLNNFISNALKFTEEGGSIKVELKELEGKVRVAVIDTGIGIAKQELPKLFQKFSQVSKLADKERKGLGLGLSIVKELIERHGGEVWAESRLGVGSKFYFTLPRVYSIAYLAKDSREAINALLAQGQTVHVVNLHIINYPVFRQRIKVSSAALLRDLERIIKEALSSLPGGRKEKPRVLSHHVFYPECSIILTRVSEQEVKALCDLLKEKVNAYLAENKRGEEVAIVLGVLSYPRLEEGQEEEQALPAHIRIKKIYIGAERRRHKRVECSVEVDLSSEGASETCQSVDISEGGLCLTCNEPLEKGAGVALKLMVPGEGLLNISGRVAWVKDIGKEIGGAGAAQYKAGLEFMHMRPKTRKAISAFLHKKAALAATPRLK